MCRRNRIITFAITSDSRGGPVILPLSVPLQVEELASLRSTKMMGESLSHLCSHKHSKRPAPIIDPVAMRTVHNQLNSLLFKREKRYHYIYCRQH